MSYHDLQREYKNIPKCRVSNFTLSSVGSLGKDNSEAYIAAIVVEGETKTTFPKNPPQHTENEFSYEDVNR